MTITQLGYVSLQVADLDAWIEIANDVFGFDVTQNPAAKQALFRIDDRVSRFQLSEGPTDALDAVGWEVEDADALQQLVKTVASSGIAVELGTAEECDKRHVAGLAKFKDPNGFPCEIFYGARIAKTPFNPARKTSGFKTGALGLGHIVLAADDPDKNAAFYKDILGFRLSDRVTLGSLELTFLRCNARHHSVAFSGPRPNMKTRISHVMVELNALQDVGQAYDICQSKQRKMRMSLGQHINDQVVSFYVETASGFAFEYGYGGVEVDETSWTVEHYTTGSTWGHRLGG